MVILSPKSIFWISSNLQDNSLTLLGLSTSLKNKSYIIWKLAENPLNLQTFIISNNSLNSKT
jgi:hypothetical protein